jgi:hypothetical protein
VKPTENQAKTLIGPEGAEANVNPFGVGAIRFATVTAG